MVWQGKNSQFRLGEAIAKCDLMLGISFVVTYRKERARHAKPAGSPRTDPLQIGICQWLCLPDRRRCLPRFSSSMGEQPPWASSSNWLVTTGARGVGTYLIYVNIQRWSSGDDRDSAAKGQEPLNREPCHGFPLAQATCDVINLLAETTNTIYHVANSISEKRLKP